MRATSWLIIATVVVSALGLSEARAQAPYNPNVTWVPQQRYVQPQRQSAWSSFWGRGSNMGQLPYSRRYYQGRYYAPFNDRFYGPQYGNF